MEYIIDSTGKEINIARLSEEIYLEELGYEVQYITNKNNELKIGFDSPIDLGSLTTIVSSHNGLEISSTKIEKIYGNTGLNFKDLDYAVKNLFPNRVFVKGELREVQWYSDEEKTDLVLEVIITYTRNVYGFATSRITTRTWNNEDGTLNPDVKVTKKIYSNLEMIEEGKIRRANIVNGIQLPTMSFMVETVTETPETVLLMGRDFLDRHEEEFSKFIGNSSSITDIASPDFGKKNIVVALELAATTTDTWLKNTPAILGGATIEQYLIGEFTI